MILYHANFALGLLTQIEFGANQIPSWHGNQWFALTAADYSNFIYAKHVSSKKAPQLLVVTQQL